MPTNVSLSTPRNDGSAVLFPDCCVCCGAAKEAESTLAVTRLVTVGKRRRQEPVKHSWQVPHCRRCARSTRAVFIAEFSSFCLGFALVGIIVFLGVTS